MKWKIFIKVFASEVEGSPYYIQWIVWCWRKPIWVGLPLVWLTVPILAVDTIYIIVTGLVLWSKHR